MSFLLLESVSEYKTAVKKRDFEVADCIVCCRTAELPWDQRTTIAHFLKIQGSKLAGFDNQHR